MTPDTFTHLAQTVVGNNPHWKRLVAEELGVSHSCIRMWLTGHRPIPRHAEKHLNDLAAQAMREALG